MIQYRIRENLKRKSGVHFLNQNLLRQISGNKFFRPTRSRENIKKVYSFDKEKLGKGGFAYVMKARLKKDKHRVFAVKIIEKKIHYHDMVLFLKEIELLKLFDHPYIVKFYEVYEDKHNLYLVQEYCAGGELQDKIDVQVRFREEETRNYLWQMLLAVNYIHSRGIAHRDLKPQNFMFKEQYGDQLKMIDFGLSQSYQKDKSMQTIAGSPCYLSPEVLDQTYSQKCDVWSLGVVLYQLVTGELPFYSENNKEIFEQIYKGKYDLPLFVEQGVSKECVDLLKKMIVVGEDKRISIEEAIYHPWFQPKITEISKKSESLITAKHLRNLRQFCVSSMFQREMIGMMVQAFRDDEEIQDLMHIFMGIDDNFSGVLTKKDLQILFNKFKLYILDEEIEDIIDSLYIKEKGIITFLEFEAALLDISFFTDEKRTRTFFKYFDIDGDGFISQTEIINCFRRFGREMDEIGVRLMVSEVDENSDGLISYEEFRDLMKGAGAERKSLKKVKAYKMYHRSQSDDAVLMGFEIKQRLRSSSNLK